MNVSTYVPALVSSGIHRYYEPRNTTKFGMLRSAMGLVQAEPNACDVSSTRSTRPNVVTTNKRDQEV